VNDLQRTRSGRISRPPQHRIKDYKLLRPSKYDNLDNTLGYHDYDPKQIKPQSTVTFQGKLFVTLFMNFLCYIKY